MSGPDCPIHGKPMDYLSTWNQWKYYCKQCDKRYNDSYQTMGEDFRAEGLQQTPQERPEGRDLRRPSEVRAK